jgi:hypothetical protein
VQHGGRCVAQVEALGGGADAIAAAKALTGHLVLQVEPRAEAPPRAGDHDAAHLGVVVQLDQRLRECVEHGAGNRVQSLGTIQGDDGNPIVSLDE